MDEGFVDHGKYFTKAELRCRCGCREARMSLDFMKALDILRESFGKPIRLSSAYRCPAFNSKVSRTGETGPHTTGRAVDILVHSADAWEILELATAYGFWGIGISQRGAHNVRFIHLDDLSEEDGMPRPMVWTY